MPSIAVDSAQRIQPVKYLKIIALPPEWFEKMKPGIRGEDVALPNITPTWALADLISRERWCDFGLGTDDNYWYMATASDLID